MELRQYWGVIWKRRWLVLAVVVLAGLFSAYSFLTAGRTYEGEAIFTVRYPQVGALAGGTPTAGDNGGEARIIFPYGDYYNYLSSEYIVDDYTQIIETDAFGTSVLKMMQDRWSQERVVVSDTARYGQDLAKLKSQDIVGMMGADRSHRELRLFVVGPTRDLTTNVLDAAGIVLTEARLEPVRGRIIDAPIFGQLDTVTNEELKSSTSKEITNAITRVVMGLVLALALAFLLEYLDNSVRDERDARRVLELPVLGAIPRA